MESLATTRSVWAPAMVLIALQNWVSEGREKGGGEGGEGEKQRGGGGREGEKKRREGRQATRTEDRRARLRTFAWEARRGETRVSDPPARRRRSTSLHVDAAPRHCMCARERGRPTPTRSVVPHHCVRARERGPTNLDRWDRSTARRGEAGARRSSPTAQGWRARRVPTPPSRLVPLPASRGREGTPARTQSCAVIPPGFCAYCAAAAYVPRILRCCCCVRSARAPARSAPKQR
jgi:hypothetical protein